MISIVVCSVKEMIFNKFSESVQATIGVPFEIIRIDNSKNEYSICAAYNKGKAKCKYDIICFSHEDVLFETSDWGNILANTLKDPTIGMAGIFGACYVSSFAEDIVSRKECIGQVIEGYKDDKPLVTVSRFLSGTVAEVVAIDGVFMVTKKTIINKISFSDGILRGFHGYDFDICMQIRQNYKVVVTRNIILSHLSIGDYSTSYFEAIKIVSKKWSSYLPAYLSSYSKNEINKLKIKSLEFFCKNAIDKKSLIKKLILSVYYAAKQDVLIIWVSIFFKKPFSYFIISNNNI
jgi:Glycosyltransferase like family